MWFDMSRGTLTKPVHLQVAIAVFGGLVAAVALFVASVRPAAGGGEQTSAATIDVSPASFTASEHAPAHEAVRQGSFRPSSSGVRSHDGAAHWAAPESASSFFALRRLDTSPTRSRATLPPLRVLHCSWQI